MTHPAWWTPKAAAPAKRRLFSPQRFAESKPPYMFLILTLGHFARYGHPIHDRTAFSGWRRAYLNTAAPTQRREVVRCGDIITPATAWLT